MAPLAISDSTQAQAPASDLERGYDTRDGELRVRRRLVTREIESLLRRAVQDRSSALSARDSADFIRMGITDAALEAGGAVTESEKLKFVVEMKDYALNFVVEAHRLGDDFLRKIGRASAKGWISDASAKRWTERLKEHSGSWPETLEFLESFDDAYIGNWKELSEDIAEVKKLQKALKVDSTEIRELEALGEKGFAEEHYLDKRNAVSFALAALKTHAKGTKEAATLHKNALAVLTAAADEKILSRKKIGPWLDHIVSGARTLEDLKAFVIDWRRVRFLYDEIESRIEERGREPQGFSRKSPEEFLIMSYGERIRHVQDAKWRLDHEKDIGPDSPIKDLKGKIRHAMDQQDWEEAEHYLGKAWNTAQPEDVAELHSIEQHLAKFQTKKTPREEKKGKATNEVRRAYDEIGQALALLPTPLYRLYVQALGKGAETTRCVTNCVFNRTWCQDRGFLTEALEEHLREQSYEETARRLAVSGEGHHDGRENSRVDGFNQPSIRNKGIGPQNLFMGTDGADAFVEKAHANRNVWSFWYWTNLIVDDVSASQNNYVSRNLNRIFKRNARILERHGLFYSPGPGPMLSVN